MAAILLSPVMHSLLNQFKCQIVLTNGSREILYTSGNEIGLSLKDWKKLPKADQERMRAGAYTRMYQSGAHYVVDAITDIVPCLDDIEARLARGERPKGRASGRKPHPQTSPTWETKQKPWPARQPRDIAVNLTGTFHCIRAAVPPMTT